MKPSQAELDDLLAPMREALRADGADVEVLDWDDQSLSVRLVLESVDCEECVLPRASLEQTMLTMLQPGYTGLQDVRLTDPRESGSRA
ncbi:MAG: hypothetical protein GEV07_00175 [Streptosporangiales bacterium]|nr:hypothetical protein [Streptosporangiales bacterium]